MTEQFTPSPIDLTGPITLPLQNGIDRIDYDNFITGVIKPVLCQAKYASTLALNANANLGTHNKPPARWGIDFQLDLTSNTAILAARASAVSGDLFLLFGQDNQAENGLYLYVPLASGAKLVRPPFAATAADYPEAMTIRVGPDDPDYARAEVMLVSAVTTLDVDDLTFDLFGLSEADLDALHAIPTFSVNADAGTGALRTGSGALVASVMSAGSMVANFFGDGNAAQAASGLLRAEKNVTAVAARNAANSADLTVLSTDSSDDILIGDSTHAASVQTSVKSGGFLAMLFAGTEAMRFNATSLLFAAGVSGATIKQGDFTTNSATANALGIHAANATGTGATGAALDLITGSTTAAFPGSNHGPLNIKLGGTTMGSYTYSQDGSDARFTLGATMPAFVFAANQAGQALFFQGLGASGSVWFQTGTTIFTDGSAGVTLTFNTNATGATTIDFTPTCTPTIKLDTQTSDVAPHDFTLSAGAPWASASSHKDSGNLILSIPAPVAGGDTGSVSVFISGAQRYIFDDDNFSYLSAVGGLVFEVTPTLFTLATPTLQFANTVVAPTLNQADNSTGGATGAALSLLGQKCTGTGSTGGSLTVGAGDGVLIGGSLNLHSGAGTAKGAVTIKCGTSFRFSADGTGIAFYDGSTVAQATRVGQLTNSTTGTPSTTIGDVGSSFSQSGLNNIHASLLAKINALELVVHNVALTS